MAYRTPRKQYSTRTPQSGRNGKDGPGLFQNGGWFCDCEPRLPATPLIQVKSDRNGNKGKWFYTCQKERLEQCTFFLWKDDAEPREKGALLSSSIGPKAPPIQTSTPKPLRQRHLDGMVPELGKISASVNVGRLLGGGASTSGSVDQLERHVRFRSKGEDEDGLFVEQATPSAKRKRVKMEEEDNAIQTVGGTDDDDEYGDLDLGSDGEKEMAQLADVASSAQSKQGASWISGGSQNLSQITPSTLRNRGSLPTPVSRNTLLIASEERGAKRPWVEDGSPTSSQDPYRTSQSSTQSPAVIWMEQPTSTPGRLRENTMEVLLDSVTSPSTGGEDYEVTNDVMCLLKGQEVDESVRVAIQNCLNTYALKMRGIEASRDMNRNAVKDKDSRIAELQEKVAALENENKATRETIRRIRDISKF